MSKTKASGMSRYEIMFIVPNKFTEDEAKTIIGRVEKMIEGAEGKIAYSEYWGKKKLAYEIKHNVYGYYQLYQFDLNGKDLAKIDTDLRLSHEILRHQILKVTVKTPEELAKAKASREKLEAKKEEEAAKKEEAARPTKKVVVKEENRAELKDLDEKLEGILNAKDLI
ncbi:MAG: 30S ribosomal protein S6 [Candidatus Falkowbacteria bacterium]